MMKKKLFIQKYNKSNNRLFTPCKKYMIDDYKSEVEKYEKNLKYLKFPVHSNNHLFLLPLWQRWDGKFIFNQCLFI